MKNPTDLQKYLDRVEQRKAKRDPLSLTMPSGIDWLVLPISIPQMAISGRLPTGLLRKSAEADQKPLTQAEQAEAGLKAMEMTRDVMLNNLIFPKITLTPEPDAICIDNVGEMIDPEDFEYFMQWLLAGGQATQNSFRQPTAKKRR